MFQKSYNHQYEPCYEYERDENKTYKNKNKDTRSE